MDVDVNEVGCDEKGEIEQRRNIREYTADWRDNKKSGRCGNKQEKGGKLRASDRGDRTYELVHDAGLVRRRTDTVWGRCRSSYTSAQEPRTGSAPPQL
jgi:hypothetical protein